MCGRFVVSYSYDELLKILDDDFFITSFEYELLPNYNVSPSESITSIIYHNHSYKAGQIIFGGKEYDHFLINTRSERIIDQNLLENTKYKKCIIPANGFYEWDSKTKDPYYLYNENILYFAGLYQKNSQGFFATIITKEATKDILDIHSRVPVILTSKQAKNYLKQNDFEMILKTSNQKPLTKHRVSKTINKPSNKDASNITIYEELRLL